MWAISSLRHCDEQRRSERQREEAISSPAHRREEIASFLEMTTYSINFGQIMKKLLTVLFLFLTATGFAQTKKVALLTTSLSPDDELNYETFIRPYVEEHLKNIPGVTVIPVSATISNAVKIKRNAVSGSFSDNAVVKTAAATGADELALVYYNVGIIEKKVLDPGLESTSYGCEMEFYIQLVNTLTAQIINSKKFYFSMGMKYKQGENYKTKEEAVKAALASPAFADDKKTIAVNADTYLEENIK